MMGYALVIGVTKTNWETVISIRWNDQTTAPPLTGDARDEIFVSLAKAMVNRMLIDSVFAFR